MYRSHRAFLSPGDALGPRDSIAAADWRDAAPPNQRRYEHPKSSFLINSTSLQLYRGNLLLSSSLLLQHLLLHSQYPLHPDSSFSFCRINHHSFYWQRAAAHWGVCSLLLGAPSGDQPRATGTAVRPVSP